MVTRLPKHQLLCHQPPLSVLLASPLGLLSALLVAQASVPTGSSFSLLDLFFAEGYLPSPLCNSPMSPECPDIPVLIGE